MNNPGFLRVTSFEPNHELLWRQYSQHVDLYKFYVEATIKLMAFHYAITGAILSFYFAHSADSTVRWALLLPVAFSISLTLIFWRGATLLKAYPDGSPWADRAARLGPGLELPPYVAAAEAPRANELDVAIREYLALGQAKAGPRHPADAIPDELRENLRALGYADSE